MKRHVAPMLEREHGADFKDFVALNAIESGSNYPRLMCERLAMTPSGISRMLDDLVKRDLVKRALDPHDSRRVQLHITPRGEAVLSATKRTMLGLLERGLSALPEAQVQLFADTLQQLSDTLTHAAEEAESSKTPASPESEST